MLLGWLNDNCPVALQGKPWPDISIDDTTVATYKTYFREAKDAGFNAFTLWGLYCSHAWPVPLNSPEIQARRKFVDAILNEAHQQGIKALFGIGVYSWGFDEIIKHDPTCARNEGRMVYGSIVPDNGVAMCYHEPSAREWMRKIIDFCVKDLGAKGFGFQPADLGRCYCHDCRLLSDIEYYTRVTNETAAYARSIDKDLILGLSGWGVEIGGPIVNTVKLAKDLDFVTDVSDQSAARGRAFRKDLASKLPCALGSLGGPVIVPPQRWNRNRWFFPHAALTGTNIRELGEDGGTAFEFFVGPLNNPQGEVMLHFVGEQLQHPDGSVEHSLGRVVDKLLNPSSLAARKAIVDWLLAVEAAFVKGAGKLPGGEFDFEPLKTEFAGPPIYLDRLQREALRTYRNDLAQLKEQLPELARGCRKPDLLSRIDDCLVNVLKDIDAKT
jgi:hypothetical protein